VCLAPRATRNENAELAKLLTPRFSAGQRVGARDACTISPHHVLRVVWRSMSRRAGGSGSGQICWARNARFFAAALWLLVVGACGGKGQQDGVEGGEAGMGSTAVVAAEFPERYAAAFCALVGRCCGASGDQVAECRVKAEGEQGLQAASARQAGARFDADVAGACLTELDSHDCEVTALELLAGFVPGCASVWRGQVPLGEACESELACEAEGDASVGCVDGTCLEVEYLLPNSDCDPNSRTAVCASAFSRCNPDSLRCVPLPTDGQVCSGDCRLGYGCREGTCQHALALGADCTSASDCLSALCVEQRCAPQSLTATYCPD